MNNEREKSLKTGLSQAQVLESRGLHGENVLTPPRRRSLWRLYLEKYDDPIIRILLVAAAISLCLSLVGGELVETIGIVLAVFFATTVGFYFERDAARKFDVLTQLGEDQPVKVLRDGHVQQVARREVVVGDVVLVETGDEVPADGELFATGGMEVDESSLTGEPVAEKQAGDRLSRSSMVMSGMGRMLVTAVGDATEIGQVAREATELTALKTPLNQQLDRLAKLISKIGSAVSVLAFLAFLLHDILTNALWHTDNYIGMAEVVLRYFMMAVTLIVMAVPEGLPMAVTLALALNMRRMLRSNNLVRKLQASETMGAVTVICTDKTGTLTENRMTVQELHEWEGYDERDIYRAIAINTTAYIAADGKGIGNPTEAALLRWMQQRGADYAQVRAEGRIIDQLPFSTERKFMATLAELADGSRVIYIKGAPEIVLDYCNVDKETRAAALSILEGYQQKSMRTLMLAVLPTPNSQLSTLNSQQSTLNSQLSTLNSEKLFRLQAVVGISDPVRKDVPKAVGDCRRAGIEVKVVTGDNRNTALQIARQIGLFDDKAEGFLPTGREVVDGAVFAAMDDAEALQCVRELRVMSRARPADKQRLVQLLEQQGEVVAVTGDGTNDAPALNHAHVGVSLGSGTSVAKEASDITLLDDSFRSLVRAVEWGRSLYKNIQRFIFFQLVVNVTALLLVLGGSVIGTEMPLTVTQILWVNLIMDTFAAMALASLPPSHEVLDQKPRQASDFIITPPMARAIAFWGFTFFVVTFAYLYWLENSAGGQGVDTYELTKFFTVFVMLQWWNLFNARTLGSRHSCFRHFFWGKGFVLVLAAILAGQWMIVEWGSEMFRTVPLPPVDWLKIIASTCPVVVAGELYRLYQRLRKQ